MNAVRFTVSPLCWLLFATGGPAPVAAQTAVGDNVAAAAALSEVTTVGTAMAGATADIIWMPTAMTRLEDALVAQYGAGQQSRVRRGLAQVAGFWRADDGDQAVFESFVQSNFAGDQATRDALFERFEFLLEQYNGHSLEILLAMRWQTDLEIGPILPMDRISAAFDPSDHRNADMFGNKLAFVVLLNFPLTTLEQKLAEGGQWTRRQWAETRLAEVFSRRLPTDVQQALSRANANADQYIADYNIWMHHLLDADGRRLFPAGTKLLTHWNLRDQIKADYTAPEDGLARQRMTRRVMERIVDQSIPATVIDNPLVDWNPYSNEVQLTAIVDSDRSASAEIDISAAPEPDRRYAIWLDNFHAQQLADAYSPLAPTHVARVFDIERELPEARVEAMFEQILGSPLMVRVAALIEARLGRPLEPHDIWYNGFRAPGVYTQAELDAITRQRYPTAAAYEADMPRLLVDLGFAPARAAELASRIAVDPARGSGHAWGAEMRSAKARLRTRVGADGMDYKGYNIAVHEMGHNVEQTISLDDMDYYSLRGVPNTAFTEALAFVFQARDLQLLGLARPDADSRAMQVLDDFWSGAEIAAVALVDMRVWHWMYEHPEATPAQLKGAVLDIARDVWNTYFAGLLGQRDVILLAIYSHMINNMLYLPNYPIGAMIARQIEDRIEAAGDLGGEFDRMCRIGDLTPDLWMQQAAGAPVGPDALLAATERAVAEMSMAGR